MVSKAPETLEIGFVAPRVTWSAWAIPHVSPSPCITFATGAKVTTS